jgi:hypothetical protein
MFLATALIGCAKFPFSRKLNIGPVGENTVSLMGDVQAVMTTKKPFSIKPYRYGQNIEELYPMLTGTANGAAGKVTKLAGC